MYIKISPISLLDWQWNGQLFQISSAKVTVLTLRTVKRRIKSQHTFSFSNKSHSG